MLKLIVSTESVLYTVNTDYTKDLCTRKRWKLFLSPEQVLVCEGQLAVELSQL